jgi:hypothetical protein
MISTASSHSARWTPLGLVIAHILPKLPVNRGGGDSTAVSTTRDGAKRLTRGKRAEEAIMNMKAFVNALDTDEFADLLSAVLQDRRGGVFHALSAHEKVLVRDGRWIQAMKDMRHRTGLSLKDVKDYVEAYRSSLPAGAIAPYKPALPARPRKAETR